MKLFMFTELFDKNQLEPGVDVHVFLTKEKATEWWKKRMGDAYDGQELVDMDNCPTGEGDDDEGWILYEEIEVTE